MWCKPPIFILMVFVDIRHEREEVEMVISTNLMNMKKVWKGLKGKKMKVSMKLEAKLTQPL